MATRPYWSGQIRLSLVSLPVNIYAALNSARSIPLHEIYRKTGERVRHQYMAEDMPIDREDIVKGYEYKKGKYVLLEPEEIKKLKLPSKNTLEIVQFVPAHEIEPLFYEKPYYVVPKEGIAEDAFVTIREGLRKTGMYGVGQLTIGGRERLCALKPYGRGMMLETIRYHEEVRKADAYFDEIDAGKTGKEEIALIEQLIKQKGGHFAPEKFHDHYRDALQELIDAKLEDREPEYEEEDEAPAKVVNLMDALRKSLGQKESKAKNSAKPKKAAGKKGKIVAIAKPKVKAKPKAKPAAKRVRRTAR